MRSMFGKSEIIVGFDLPDTPRPYSLDEWRKALREAVEKAAVLEANLQRAKEAMKKNEEVILCSNTIWMPPAGDRSSATYYKSTA